MIYKVVDSIESDEAKKIVRAIKDLKLKVTPSIQGDEVESAVPSLMICKKL